MASKKTPKPKAESKPTAEPAKTEPVTPVTEETKADDVEETQEPKGEDNPLEESPTMSTPNIDSLLDALNELDKASDEEKKKVFAKVAEMQSKARPLYKHPIVKTVAVCAGTIVVVETGTFAARKLFGGSDAELIGIDGQRMVG